MKYPITTKLVKPHKKDCWALAEAEAGDVQWPAPWAFFAEQTHQLDAIGRKGGNRTWLEAVCNEITCPARLLVLEADLLLMLPNGAG